MTPLYVTSPVSRVTYSAVLVLWVLSEVFVFVRNVTVAGDRRQDRLSGPALIGFLLVGVWLGSVAATGFPGYAITQGRSTVFAFGVLLALGGIAFRWYAITTLGRFFTTRVMTVAEQKVVDTGPYRWIRHPSYTGALMTVLGVLLCATNWISLVCFALALPGFAYRIRVEERALAAALGQPYEEYMRRTKRLVPFVV